MDQPRAAGLRATFGVPLRGFPAAAARSLGRRAGAGWAAARRLAARPHAWGMFGLVLGTALLQGGIGIQQYHRFRLGGYDLVIFDQGIRNYAHGNLPVSVFKDVQDAAQVSPGYMHPFSILGDHFSPVLALLAPLYWIWNNPQVLLIAQAVLFALAVPSVWLFSRRALARIATPRRATIAAYLVAAAFGLSWPLQEASAAGFHEVAFFVPISAIMIERYQAGRLKHMIWCAVALLTVKEDAGYVVSAFGLLLLLTRQVNGTRLERRVRRGYRIAGAALGVGGVAFAMLVLHVWIPAFGGRSDFYWYYTQLGPDMAGALKTLVTRPAYALQVATQPGMKIHTVFFLFWPLLYLSLASPISLLAVPLLAERAFSNKPEHWNLDQQYNAFLAAILVMAAVDGLGRVWRRVIRPALPLLRRVPLPLPRRAARRAAARSAAAQLDGGPPDTSRAGGAFAVGWATLIFLFSCVIIHTFPMGSVFNLGQWQSDTVTTAENQAVALIPDGACVEADNDIATHLSARTQVLLLDEIPRGCPWVVLQIANPSYPLNDPQLVSERADWLAANGYQLVFSEANVSVYHRP